MPSYQSPDSALAHAEWPTTPIPEPIKTLLHSFFELGDSTSPADGARMGTEIFTPDGQIVVNKRVIDGAEEISNSNHGKPPGLQRRKHRIDKIYTCNEMADDLMLFGVVTWTFDDGQTREGRFAARAVVVVSEGRPRLKLYQGWSFEHV
ncbi:hypothetical protein PV08_05593 [Exophiala spinifera]|uniref:SnoaL-like domain-containing protein n=1 Tax=Exophiala spinifera TaxID=91928 RepID=A0A0D2BAF9_9EURO|nr:uncharacterized protein PV08_05593 [Exophiala spinifera]KIW15545.1 hypothetical protein PV08_05593 [Exophiala spinifera]